MNKALWLLVSRVRKGLRMRLKGVHARPMRLSTFRSAYRTDNVVNTICHGVNRSKSTTETDH